MKKNLPNALTIARLVMAVVFVALLSVYRYPDGAPWALVAALVVFVVAAGTDALDGSLARRWSVESVFGRIADPAADKVLVLGAFVLLASPAFYDATAGALVSGVAPWMAVLILAREIVVTTIRAAVESAGGSFGAVWSGKWKMIAQSVGAPMILLVVWLADEDSIRHGSGRAIAVTTAWVVVVVTALSGLHYVLLGVRALRAQSSADSA